MKDPENVLLQVRVPRPSPLLSIYRPCFVRAMTSARLSPSKSPTEVMLEIPARPLASSTGVANHNRQHDQPECAGGGALR